jgi:hypothetical protein
VLENPEIDELIDWQNKSKTHGLGGFLLANPDKGKSLDFVPYVASTPNPLIVCKILTWWR